MRPAAVLAQACLLESPQRPTDVVTCLSLSLLRHLVTRASICTIPFLFLTLSLNSGAGAAPRRQQPLAETPPGTVHAAVPHFHGPARSPGALFFSFEAELERRNRVTTDPKGPAYALKSAQCSLVLPSSGGSKTKRFIFAIDGGSGATVGAWWSRRWACCTRRPTRPTAAGRWPRCSWNTFCGCRWRPCTRPDPASTGSACSSAPSCCSASGTSSSTRYTTSPSRGHQPNLT